MVAGPSSLARFARSSAATQQAAAGCRQLHGHFVGRGYPTRRWVGDVGCRCRGHRILERVRGQQQSSTVRVSSLRVARHVTGPQSDTADESLVDSRHCRPRRKLTLGSARRRPTSTPPLRPGTHQALHRTQPLLPVDFGRTQKRTHDYRRHGTTNLFAALNTCTGKVTADSYPSRTGRTFGGICEGGPTAWGKEPRGPGQPVHSRHPAGAGLAERNPNVTFPRPIGSSWLDQIDTVGITPASPSAAAPSSVTALHRAPGIHRVLERRCRTLRLDRNHRRDPRQVRLVQTNIKRLVDNNAK